jgi:hypothetical protein
MRFLPALLLVATATLAGCGGGSGDGSSGAASGSSGLPVATFSVSRPWVTFNGIQGAPQSIAPNPDVVNVVMTNADVFINTSQTGTMFSHSYTADGSYAGHIAITAAYPSDPGTFSGTIIVNGCSNASGPCNHVAGSPQTIKVTYNVSGLSVTPAQLSFSSTETIRERMVTLAFTSNWMLAGTLAPWTAQISPSSTNWLSLAPSGGTARTLDSSTPSQTASVNVNAAGLSPGVYGATVTFSAPTRSPTTHMTVTLTVGDPSVNFVAPYVVPAGASGNVIIRGRGFSGLSADSLSVQFNSTPAVDAVVVSDTEIQATYPPLAAGSYSISVSSGATSIPSRAALKLLVINPPAFAFTTIPRPASAGPPANLIYDAERQALLFVDRQRNLILRYAFSRAGSNTSLMTGGPIGGIALSPDGTELIQTGAGTLLVRLDPVTLAVLSSVGVTSSWGSNWARLIAFANDGGAIGNGGSALSSGETSLYRYDMLTQAVTPVSFQSPMRYRQIVASADGDTLLLLNYQGSSTDKRVYTYDASTGALTPRPPSTSGPSTSTAPASALSMSRNASRIIFVNDSSPTPITVYDAEFNALGTLPNGASTFVLSPDGDVAYAYYPPEGRVRKFNVNASGGVSEIGTGSALAPANTEMSEMTISPDGGTLFLAGTTSVVIAPAP